MIPEPTSLDSESYQVREVYAYFGLAMYWAQCLEQSIFLNLLVFEHFPKAIPTYTTPEAWAESLDQYEARELSQTMGKLIRRLRDAGQSTALIEQLLDHALKSRNWLAHGFFSDRALDFVSPDGRVRMLEELDTLRDLFASTAHEIDAVTMPIAKRYGLTDEKLAEIEAQMLADYAKRDSNA